MTRLLTWGRLRATFAGDGGGECWVWVPGVYMVQVSVVGGGICLRTASQCKGITFAAVGAAVEGWIAGGGAAGKVAVAARSLYGAGGAIAAAGTCVVRVEQTDGCVGIAPTSRRSHAWSTIWVGEMGRPRVGGRTIDRPGQHSASSATWWESDVGVEELVNDGAAATRHSKESRPELIFEVFFRAFSV